MKKKTYNKYKFNVKQQVYVNGIIGKIVNRDKENELNVYLIETIDNNSPWWYKETEIKSK